LTSNIDTGSFKSLTTITPEEAQDLRRKFITIGETTFIAISNDLVRRFNIDERTWAYQYGTENGIYIAFRDNKNRDVGTTGQ
jgi:hypothetical protein